MAAEKTMQALLEGIDYEAEVGFEGSIFGRDTDRSRSARALAVHGRRKESMFGHSCKFQAVFAKGLHVAVTRSGGNRRFDPWRASLEKEIGLQISSGPRLLLMINGDNLIEGGPTLNQIKLQKERLLLSGSATETEEKGETAVHRCRLDCPAASHRSLRRSPNFSWQMSKKKKASWVRCLQRKDRRWDRFLFRVTEPWEGKGFIPIYGGFAERPRGDEEDAASVLGCGGAVDALTFFFFSCVCLSGFLIWKMPLSVFGSEG
ncbi:hypothetical protein MRB53_014345 [Persea americana]|uniref:Uncharacterized protein n=1 Tax=Persea americana TaxID=3435 RepID=A0ACC2KAI4_PERAE|nr:hypothetical protein MRB53_014345 [Persea americana]